MDFYRGKRVLVTGGAGFIGSHLVEALLQADAAEVAVLDNFATGHRRNLHAGAVLLEGDIRDLSTCQDAAEGRDVIFHQAALGSVPRSLATPSDTYAVNVGGTANMFTAARDQEVARVVYASSSSVYGDSELLPKKEGSEGTPLSPYALSKHMNEELATNYARCFQLEPVGLRYFNVYGPRQDPNGPYAAVIPRFFDAYRQERPPTIFGDGEQSRDFTFVLDAVQANLRAGQADATSTGRAYNVGAGGRTTVNVLDQEVRKLCAREDLEPTYKEPRPGDVRHSHADISDAREHLRYAPEFELHRGLAAAAEFYLNG
ncbi:MAG: NAD-dependent epimerase/dehydratase family protein [Myxococcota bacterium]